MTATMRPAHPDPADGDHPLDEAVWNLLRGEIGDEAMRRYVASYLNLLPERLDGAEGAVAAGRRSDAAKLLADLRTNSAMLGADRLTALTAAAEAALHRGPSGDAAVDWPRLRVQAGIVERAVRRALGGLWRECGLQPSDPPNL